MIRLLSDIATRFRLLVTRALSLLGFGGDSFLLFLAVVVGIVTAVAALGFHELTNVIRDRLYHASDDGQWLYNRYIWLIVLFPAAGGLIVGFVSRVFRVRAGHGVVDVIESVIRTTGFVKPKVAIEKILSSAVTIGTGGSSGAEGPIVQIGAAVAGGIGALFRISRQHMPVIVGCGCAAGISAIFNAPLGGLLFTLEVILFDFSVRTITPLVVASVIANVTTRVMHEWIHGDGAHYNAIFASTAVRDAQQVLVEFSQVGNFALLGLACGVVSVTLTKMMGAFERKFERLDFLGMFKPALGGGLVGILGVVYVLIFGWAMLHRAKPIDVGTYPMPAFFGDGYGVIGVLLNDTFFAVGGGLSPWQIVYLLAFLLVAKIVATCLTLASGGSGGVIAPALFLGATTGALAGMLLRVTGLNPAAQPGIYALVGMGACLAGVVHAPLASVLILFEITQDYRVLLAAMLCSIVSIGTSRVFEKDSIYMKGLRHRGLAPGHSESTALHRLTLEHVALEPAVIVRMTDPFTRVLDQLDSDRRTAPGTFFVVVDPHGQYRGVLTADDLQMVLRQPEAVPLMIASEIARTNVPLLANTDTLADAFEAFSRFDVTHLPVGLVDAPGKVIGVISRAGLMRRYHHEMRGNNA